MNYGFVRLGAAVPGLKVADTDYNSNCIINSIKESQKDNIQIIVFPELCVTSYTCGDLFYQRMLIEKSKDALLNILKETKNLEVVSIIGMPVEYKGSLFNCGVVIQKGDILGIVPKVHLPNYSEFYEKRWFVSGKGIKNENISFLGKKIPFGIDIIFGDSEGRGILFGVEICEDLWVPIPPSCNQSLGGAIILFNLSSSNELVGKHEYRKNIINMQSSRCSAAYVYTSSGYGESTTDVVFGGHAVISEYGNIMEESTRFSDDSQIIYADIDSERLLMERKKSEGHNISFSSEYENNKYRVVEYEMPQFKPKTLNRFIDPNPFVPSDNGKRDERCREIFEIQTQALVTRYRATGSKKSVIGISGGLDSTLALLVNAKAFDRLGISRENIIAITMPGFGTTDGTYSNARDLIKNIGATFKEINIKEACLKHFTDIGHDPDIHDITYENTQARERTQILMDVANKEGAMVIGTGDLSELALGWCTYNGDHMSMYSVNCGVPKTLVKYLVDWVASNISDTGTLAVLKRVLDTPVSPELIPPDKDGKITQKTEEIIGSYEIHDFYIYNMLRMGYKPSKMLFLAELAFRGKYTREELLDCLKTFIRRFFTQQFKRSCLPDGPKVGTVSLSPRGDWRMPSDAGMDIWIKDIF
jgi:NAD+ synthase (glutamine-hydrolysing)